MMKVKWNTGGLNLLREREVKQKIELNQIKKQTEILATFMPDKILQMNKLDLNESKSFVGVLLFIDVSGFTPLCERYNKTGKGGIYRLTATLNAYIGALVEVIYFFGGDVLKFSGDAFLALWTAPPEVCLYEVIHEVIVCSLFIQQTLGHFKTEVNVLLKVKAAIACGNLTFSVIGNTDYRHYVVIGQAINDVKEAEHNGISGDVVVSLSAWGHLSEESYEVTVTESGHVKIENCVYSLNQQDLKEAYTKKCEIAQELCEKHIEHRNSIHDMKKIDDATTDSKVTEQFIATLPKRVAVEKAPLTWIPSDLNPFIVRPVQSQIEEKQPIEYLTEMREVTIQFINIVPQSYDNFPLIAMINNAYQIVCTIVSKVKGVVNKLSLFDKDAMMLVLFGLRGVKHELESQNALKSAFTIREELVKLANVKTVSIGVTNGLVYCGVVGHPLRREYTVIGGSVNKAARIMCAYENKVTCDHVTYKSCKLSSLYFQLQSALKLKGIETAGHIFQYNESFSEIPSEVSVFGPTIGREMETDFIDKLVRNPESIGWYGLCIRGEGKVGKSKLLRYTVYQHGRNNKYILSIILNAVSYRPYYCVSALYKQLYNMLLEENHRLVAHLPTDLWDLNEIFQIIGEGEQSEDEPHRSDKETMLENLLSLCSIARKPPILLVDNVNYIDVKSLEIIDTCLRSKRLRFICAGTFDDQMSWNIMWKISLSNQIKLHNLDPLNSVHLLPLLCKFLKVRGVAKKLLVVIDRICEGKPGWIETCLLKMINNEELEVKYWNLEEEFVFIDGNIGSSVVLVASFSKKYIEGTEDITLAAISLDLFDSFSAHQQLIIKTAAVLGEIFNRTTLMILLKYPNENMMAAAIKTLFEEDVFDCASRYINSGGLQDKKYKCLCYADEEDYENLPTTQKFPRYAYCRLLHFKNKNIRVLAYELLPNNQKKELHLRITDLLENQNNSCPNCLRDDSAAIIKLMKFNKMLAICTDPCGYKDSEILEEGDSADAYKDMIRSVIKKTGKRPEGKASVHKLPKRKLWDPSVCFCVEILFKVYRDLIYHSHYGEHIGKKIYFMVQYAEILQFMNESEDAIPILNEASEICLAFTESYLLTGNFKLAMFCKIHVVLGFLSLKLGDSTAAKNHAMIALRQYNIPLISFSSSVLRNLISRACIVSLGKRLDQTNESISMLKLDFGMCIGLVSAIYAFDGKWNIAKEAISRSLFCITMVNPNLKIFCDVYTNALELYIHCGDTHVCEKLERCVNNELLKFYSSNATNELYMVTRIFVLLFYMKLLNGNISNAITVGFRILSLNLTIHAYYRLMELGPTLAVALYTVQRVNEAVYVARILYNIGAKYHAQGYLMYYLICINLILDTNFYLEPLKAIEEFCRNYFKAENRCSKTGNFLLTSLHNYYLRRSTGNMPWKVLYEQLPQVESSYSRFPEVYALVRSTECSLLEMVHHLDSPDKMQFKDAAKKNLKNLEIAATKFNYFLPRYLHLRAYHHRISDKVKKSKRILKKANKAANMQGNTLEACWTDLHTNYWYGGFAFEKHEIKPINWNQAASYSPLQWCYVLNVLPLN